MDLHHAITGLLEADTSLQAPGRTSGVWSVSQQVRPARATSDADQMRAWARVVERLFDERR